MHQIVIRDYPEHTDKRIMTSDSINTVSRNGDRYGTELIQYSDMLFDSREKAEDWVYKDHGFYAGVAVRYKDLDGIPDTAEVKRIRDRIKLLQQKSIEVKNDVAKRKCKLISCSKCESKIAREYVRRSICPVCGNDLTSEAAKKEYAEICEKIQELYKKIEQKKINSRKAKIRWLVKFEYHC